MGLCPSPTDCEPPSLFLSAFLSARLFFLSTRVKKLTEFFDSLSDPTTMLSEHVFLRQTTMSSPGVCFCFRTSLPVMTRGLRGGSKRGCRPRYRCLIAFYLTPVANRRRHGPLGGHRGARCLGMRKQKPIAALASAVRRLVCNRLSKRRTENGKKDSGGWAGDTCCRLGDPSRNRLEMYFDHERFQGLMMQLEGLMMEPEGRRVLHNETTQPAMFGLVDILVEYTLTMIGFQGLITELKFEAPSSDPESQSWSKYISGPFQQAQIWLGYIVPL
ncbi:hypothetical protein EVAR_79637_1 [Eumeta japonica]|uniref:Uncharacterized protein n=1 Tax=Eumeta variegata TaxID=151549 RepID=A0A4C1UF78_EUMVA|nr:hypothetical protein EVAR_79637_1 [Eumeta japonica]